MAIRVDQSVIEIIVLPNPHVRVNQSVVEFVIVPVPPSISCGNPPPAPGNVPYSHTFPVTGGRMPFTFSIIAGALPPGLTLDISTGVVSGTPTEAGAFTFTILVVDANLLSSSVQCTITILGILKITLRGVNRRPCDSQAPEEYPEVKEAPPVERAI
jgi:hypothetical protein